ncbi:MAG: glutathione peroxidase [Nocardioides sp.]|uniref:glutathione peroxidase n=1 Tax=Nocardioides sp. TaxID=35761 RepID=UPI0032632ACC
MSILDAPLARLDGTPGTLRDLTGGRPALLVNVASKCGLTPQYSTLEQLQATYADRGFTVVGLPCNQFGGQEPGSSEEIAEFCSATYGVSFPMSEKVEVNGNDRHEIYSQIVETPNEKGETGDVQWNFEKFLIGADGAVVARFNPGIKPDDAQITGRIESLLA